MNHQQRYLGLAACALALAACTGDGRAGPTTDGDDEPTTAVAQPVLAVTADSVRFLEQATFGVTPATVTAFDALGATPTDRRNAWIAAQVALPASHYDLNSPIREQFFKIAISKDDQLRQRVAFALSQIFVISRIKLKDDTWMVPFANMLVDKAFLNLQDVLVAVAESPAMGEYLDNANNFVVDTQHNSIAPNENFAREVMQLFTLGLCELKPNGTLLGGVCTPPYSQGNVEDYAHLMSGWSFNTYGADGNLTNACLSAGKKRGLLAAAVDAPMLACNSADHDYTQKTLLNRFDPANEYKDGVAPPATTWTTREAMEKPLDTTAHTSGVIADLFNHPNVGPFIGKQLIQHLVTSNPSPAYVARISTVFAGDGTLAHPRGNLREVVTAILTDTEAMDASPGYRYGHLREPALYITSVMRLVTNPALADGTGLRTWSGDMGQDIFYSPTVFNYYPASYAVPTTLLPAGSTPIVGGEFGIEDTNTVLVRANFADLLLYKPNKVGGSTTLTLSNMPSDANGMVDWCNAYMMHNLMTQAMHDTIVAALTGLTGDLMRKRALYLVASSSQFQIER
jgi:uncharacterized protein (DUF1800 family)